MDVDGVGGGVLEKRREKKEEGGYMTGLGKISERRVNRERRVKAIVSDANTDGHRHR